MSILCPQGMSHKVLKAIEILCNEPPSVASVARLSLEEKQERRRNYYRQYYERNKEHFRERFRDNGANKRYYESNRAIKNDMAQFNAFIKRLERDKGLK